MIKRYLILLLACVVVDSYAQVPRYTIKNDLIKTGILEYPKRHPHSEVLILQLMSEFADEYNYVLRENISEYESYDPPQESDSGLYANDIIFALSNFYGIEIIEKYQPIGIAEFASKTILVYSAASTLFLDDNKEWEKRKLIKSHTPRRYPTWLFKGLWDENGIGGFAHITTIGPVYLYFNGF
jgi:hypothetical protein